MCAVEYVQIESVLHKVLQQNIYIHSQNLLHG